MGVAAAALGGQAHLEGLLRPTYITQFLGEDTLQEAWAQFF